MGQYSIKELEKLSGIKAHTIRIWEKRHGIIAPRRTSTNIRFYDDNDLKKILKVTILNNHGFKISSIAQLSREELNEKVIQLSTSVSKTDIHIDRMIMAMVDLDEASFEKLLGELTMKMGFENMVTNVIYPFLHKIGILWQTGNINPAQEHFMSNLIRQKIIVAIDAIPLPSKESRAPLFLVFLPEGEMHEIGLLFYHYILRKNNFRTVYLGQSVPYNDLLEVTKVHDPAFLLTVFTSSVPDEKLEGLISRLSKDFKEKTIVLSGSQITRLSKGLPSNCRKISSAQDLKYFISSL
ncbi:MerR family transcriptional regulator [Fulvivirgaceae bacterium BMA10]|uniref:MerR family transcriptional regulator n=1 Tax=Splendidivirga corallicola TaxID=3051826 RepID=A0ABT8KW45_9BACT|nr:MerR family transcriptional regulator [Fulvivirgaceae bacterium BMA10]